MGTMSRLLLERPIALSLIAVAILIVLFFIWSARRDRASLRLLFVWIGALPVLLTVSVVVVTPSEQVAAVCRQLAREVDQGNIAGISAHLADDFSAAGLDRIEFLEAIKSRLSEIRIDNPRLRAFTIEFPGDSSAEANFNASCRVRAPRMYAYIPSRWRVGLRRHDETWLVTGLQSLPVPPLHVSDLRQWLR